MMLQELEALLSFVNRPEASRGEYSQAIIEENCLGKRSGKTRELTYRHLVALYALDPTILLFRTLRFFWQRDLAGHPLLALLCAYSRDAVLRSTAPFLQSCPMGAIIFRESVEEFIDNQQPGRFSKATLKSTAQNINSTWTQSGHLSGKVRKTRVAAIPTAGSLAYALLMGYLTGARGESLFNTEYIRLLDCSVERAIDLAGDASRRGWIVFKRIGNVMEVQFPHLITAQEMEWVREQS